MRRIVWLLVFLATTLFPRQQARADLIITFTSSTLVGSAGTVLHFGGSLGNTGGTTIFLNGTSFTTTASLVINDAPFFLNVPLFLASGGTYSGPLFDASTTVGTAPGSVFNGTFRVLGGATPNDVSVLASQLFSVQVTSPISATPEPSTLTLVLAGTSMLWLLRRRKVDDVAEPSEHT
jgi:hypothetical protein